MILKLCGKRRPISPPVSSMPTIENLFVDFPNSFPEEQIETYVVSKNARIEHIVLIGQANPKDFWYDQDEIEWVVVLHGEAELEFEREAQWQRLQSGDFTEPVSNIKNVAYLIFRKKRFLEADFFSEFYFIIDRQTDWRLRIPRLHGP